MLRTLMLVGLTLAAAPAFAQSGATQSPPAPNASSSGPQPAGSVPAGAATMNPGSTANPNVSGPVSSTGATQSPAGAGPGAAMSNTVPKPQ